MYSRRYLLLVFIIPALFLLSCIERRTKEPPDRETPVSAELLAMVEEEQQMRYNDTLDWKVVAEADLKHRRRVFELLAQGAITEPENLYWAALIMDHADPSSCRECYWLAYCLAREAVNRGFEEARNLAATCLDRSLVYSGQPQKYGTQFYQDSTGRWYLFNIDSLTTDSERVLWQVPKLNSLKARLDSMNQIQP
jgi:hypothetical protein